MQVIVVVIILCLAMCAADDDNDDDENNNTNDSFDAIIVAQPVYLMNEKMWQAAANLQFKPTHYGHNPPVGN